jgi:hypothetical protein
MSHWSMSYRFKKTMGSSKSPESLAMVPLDSTEMARTPQS